MLSAQPGQGYDWVVRTDSGVEYLHTWGDPSAARAELAAGTGVVSVELFGEDTSSLQFQGTTNDARLLWQWNLENYGLGRSSVVDADIDASAAWDVTVGSRDVVIAVVDSGVDYTNRDIAANIWTNPGEVAGDGIDNDANGFIDDVHGWDFFSNDNDPRGGHYHGTAVAGVIGAVGDNGIDISGVAQQVSLMSLKISDDKGNISDTATIAAINYATMMASRGTNVAAINASWGGTRDLPGMKDSISRAGDQGILFVAGAGNDGANSRRNSDVTPFYPAGYDLPNIISVGASMDNDRKAYFSTYGRKTVDLFSPGQVVWTVVPGNLLASVGGTSFAAPHVTGTVVLIAAAYPDLPAEKIKAAILQGVDLKTWLKSYSVTGGRLNAAGALRIAGTISGA